MVQGYPIEDSSHSSFGFSLTRIRNEGNSFLNSGRKAGSGYSVFFAYRTSNLGRLHISNGGHISQKNLSYEGLKILVEKLEGLCWILHD